jgi:hypothetical protein
VRVARVAELSLQRAKLLHGPGGAVRLAERLEQIAEPLRRVGGVPTTIRARW